MKNVGRTLLLGTCAIAVALPLIAQRASQITEKEVESGSGSATIHVDMPGTVVGEGICFQGSMVLTSLSFDTGTRSFGGGNFDAHGREGSFLADEYKGETVVPATAGPAVVDISCASQIRGATNADASGTLSGISLGPNFSPSNLDLVVGAEVVSACAAQAFESTALTELSGSRVRVSGSGTVTNVDPIAGVIDVSASGKAFATDLSRDNQNVPASGTAGLILLMIGLLGVGSLLAGRRSGQPA